MACIGNKWIPDSPWVTVETSHLNSTQTLPEKGTHRIFVLTWFLFPQKLEARSTHIKNNKMEKCTDLFTWTSWPGDLRDALPSSPPEIEKSLGNIVHFCMRWALEVALALTASMAAWMHWYMALSLPPVMSDTLEAWLPSCWQNSTASRLRSSMGSMVSGLLKHYNRAQGHITGLKTEP